MSEFVYFVEGGGGHDRLEELGLADRFEETPRISSIPARGIGPEERGGAAFHVAPRLLEGLSWQAEVPSAELRVQTAPELSTQHSALSTGPRYWVGWRAGDPPGPADLARAISLRGAFVRLGDGREWLIPLVIGHESRPAGERCGLPRQPVYEAGRFVWRVRGDLLPLVERVAAVREYLAGWPAAAARCWECGVALLAAGYRVGATEVLALGLLDEDSLAAVLGVALDVYARVAGSGSGVALASGQMKPYPDEAGAGQPDSNLKSEISNLKSEIPETGN